MAEIIQSLQNDRIKNLVKLQKKPVERKEQGLFVIEGRREISLAIQNKVKPHSFFICDDIYSPDVHYPINLDNYTNIPIVKVSREVYDKIAYRGDTQGIVMAAHNLQNNIKDISFSKNGLYLVLESIEKPGNLGAVFRTADAAGVNGIIICGNSFDIYNPNAIRASLGCLFSVPFALTDNETALKALKNKDYNILAAHPEGDKILYEIDLKKPSAIIMGTESDGLSSFWKKNADQLITIPMMGQIDSLNISVSAAVIAYEGRRQRLI